jgi:hypothetical protein
VLPKRRVIAISLVLSGVDAVEGSPGLRNPSPFIETAERLGEETMEAVYKIAREVGALGTLALLVLAYVAAAGTEANLKEWHELGFQVTIVQGNRVAVVVGIVLFLVQAAANSRFTEREDKRHQAELALQRERSEFNVQKVEAQRDAAVADATAISMRLSGDQAVVAKQDAEWHKLESVLKGHRAIAEEDNPRFVSRVVQSAYRLREELGEFQQSGELEPPTREIALTLRWATDSFIGAVENIEYRTQLDLRVDDTRIEALKGDESLFRTAHSAWRERVNMLVRGISFGRGEVNFVAF